MRGDVQRRVLKVFCEVLDKQANEIQPSASLQADLQLDSMKQMTLFIALEDEFEHGIPPEEAEDLETVADIIRFIQARIPGAT